MKGARALVLPLLLFMASGSVAAPILELWEGRVSESSLPGYEIGDLFRFTVGYDNEASSYTLVDVGPDGISGTADDESRDWTITCFLLEECYRPISDAIVDFGSVFEDGLRYADSIGDPLRTVFPDAFNFSYRLATDIAYFGYESNSVDLVRNGLRFSGLFEATGIRPNGLDNFIGAFFFTESSRFRETFGVRFSDVSLVEIPLGSEIATGLVTTAVPSPATASLIIPALLMMLLTTKSPRLTRRSGTA